MRFGYCVNMLSTRPDGTGAEWLKEVKEAGFDYVDLPLAQVCALGEEEFNKVRNTLGALELRCEATNNFLPAAVKITGPDVDENRLQQYLSVAFDRLKQLGVSVVCVGSSGARNVPDGFPKEEAYKQLKSFFRMLGGVLPAGITAVIEPLRSDESNILNGSMEAFELMKAVDCPNVRMLVDYYHMVHEDDPFANIGLIGPNLQHVHFAAIKGRRIPHTFNETMAMFFEALKKAGYSARLSVEAYSKSPAEELPVICRSLKAYFSQS
ncbi:MAG: sugar phosphate isomerase/epimerase family protein [Christensenellales bacterium]